MSKKLTMVWALLLALVLPLSAQAASDPLDLPARLTDKAAGAMLLGVTQAGTRLVAVGERGIIVYSDNRGQSWMQAKVPVSVTLTAVQFPTAQCGWAVGHDGVVLSSNDGGQSWMKRFDGNRANALMLAEAEKNMAHVQGAGDSTATGKAAQDAAANALADIQAGAKFGPSRPLFGVWFKNTREGYVVGAFGQLFHTADGGNQWESLASRVHNPDGLHYNAISATPGGALVIAGEGGKVYRSMDGGVNWQTMDSGYAGQLFGVLGRADGSLLAFGFGGHILQGSQDGTNWQALPVEVKENLIGGTVLSNGGILLAGQDGSLLHSDDGQRFTVWQPGSGLTLAGMTLLAGGQTEHSGQIALAGMGGVHLITLGNSGKQN